MRKILAQTYALRQGAFGHVVVQELEDDLVTHSHPEIQFSFWLAGGRCEAHLANVLVKYGEHVALVTNAYESHDARLLDKGHSAVFLVLYIETIWWEERRSNRGQSFFFAKPEIFMCPSLRQACWRLLDTVISPHIGTPDQLEIQVESLLDIAMESGLTPTSNLRPLSHVPVIDHRLRAAIAYMRAHVAEPISIKDIAGRVGLSRAHFFAMFRDQLNTTPQVFWSAVRVEEVVRRLMCRDEPLTSVALELGFSSSGNFSRFFKAHMGVSPSTFRRVASTQNLNPITGITTGNLDSVFGSSD
jgi:AraC-like DNA-binding protein